MTDQLLKMESNCSQLMELMNKDAAHLAEHDISYILFFSLEPIPFSPSKNAFSEVLQSGELGLIRNKELNESLFDWERLLGANKNGFEWIIWSASVV